MPQQLNPYIGEIALFPFGFAPSGWAICAGQIMAVSQNTALFSILQTTYGGNGQTTFALPDLRGRVPLHAGQGPGLSSHDLGEVAGQETVTLQLTEIPAHTHAARCVSGDGNDFGPTNEIWAQDAGGNPQYGSTRANGILAADALGQAGGTQPHNNLSAYLTLNYCIAIEGVFPPRS